MPQASSPGVINATGALGMELSGNTDQNSSGKLKQNTPENPTRSLVSGASICVQMNQKVWTDKLQIRDSGWRRKLP